MDSSAVFPVRLLLERLEQPVSLLDEEGRISQSNLSLARALHRSRQSLEGLPFLETVDPDDRQVGEQLLQAARGSGEAGPVPLRHPERVMVSWLCARDASQALLLVGQVLPPSDDEELRRMAVVGRMTARLRHDVNNPLTTIMGMAELTMLNEPDLSEDSRRRLGTILENCTRICDLLRHIRDAREGKLSPSC
jgi:signal transduction histidine kinase